MAETLKVGVSETALCYKALVHIPVAIGSPCLPFPADDELCLPTDLEDREDKLARKENLALCMLLAEVSRDPYVCVKLCAV